MTHFLDTLPLDFSLQATRELQALLAGRYYQEEMIVELLRQTPLSPAHVSLAGPALSIWFRVLDTARNRNLLPQVLKAASGDDALRKRLDELVAGEVVEASGEPTGAPGEPAEVPWKGPPDVSGIERQLAKTHTFLDISFLDKALAAAPAVARLTVSFAGGDCYGTAFRIGPDLLLTNHHVLHDWEHGSARAAAVVAWFDYELDTAEKLKTVIEIACDPDSVVGDKSHDWAVVRAKAPIPDCYPALPLAAPRLPTSKDDRVYIIQHPHGGPKQIVLLRNLVSHVDTNVVQYLTDTDHGSSGSPVFNKRLEVVALHHRWVKVKEHKDGEEKLAYRNQGQRIERVREGLTASGLLQ